MHIEIQVALNFVISYLYNKLPRRRVNIFGEELEKALRDKFQGHWYPEKPFKGSAYRCLKTGDPIDSVLARAARESGVPISDILENLPNELSVWVDPGEVSYRIGEKGAVKILYTENNDNHEDSHSADREVTKTFNPEAQCFRPIDVVNTTMNNLSLSPKALPLPLPLPPSGSSPHSAASSSPTYKGSPNPNGGGSSGASLSGNNNVTATATAAAFVQRAAQAPLTFTTATFAQTKFGSTKLKTSSKRTNSSSYRMSPTEFSNYIKQRAMQQQLHHGHSVGGSSASAFGALDAVSPARSLSPNPLALGGNQSNSSGGVPAAAATAAAAAAAADPFYYPNIAMGLYPQYNGQRSLFEPHFNADAASLSLFGAGPATAAAAGNSFSTYLEPCYFTNGHANANANAPGGTTLINQQQHQNSNNNNSSSSSSSNNSSNNKNNNSNNSSSSSSNSLRTIWSIPTAAIAALAETECSIASASVEESGNSAGGAATGESSTDNSPIATPTAGVVPGLNTIAATAASTVSAASSAAAAAATATATTAATTAATSNGANNQDSTAAAASNSKLIDGLSSFYGTGSSYQQLLVAN
ncbi:LOW QUALITY PROTEIN: protein Tob1 [Drosophila montana]|uniref:LOW QUALITY PROTEIN: protein Tob1 n=1 Tax=Drosophila montana TaxID=40370 RepID=UPI00313D2500